MEKFQEQMIKAKAFTIKKWGAVRVWVEVPNSKTAFRKERVASCVN